MLDNNLPRDAVPGKNEYLDLFLQHGGHSFAGFNSDGDGYLLRKRLCKQYAYAVPSPNAIKALLKLCPLVEIGAGRGYWARLITCAGGKIHAYDKYVPKRTYFPVRRGGPAAVRKHKQCNLFLCWPPLWDPMASHALRHFVGSFVVYIGEGHGGCTGNDEFHGRLNADFECVQSIDIPQWWGLHDDLTIWQRKELA